MRKLSKLSLLLVFALLTSIFTPYLSSVTEANTATNVTIHKITGTEEVEGSYDALIGENVSGLNNGTPISNISFTYFKVNETEYRELMNNMNSYETAESVEGYLGTSGTVTGATDQEGEVTVSGLEEGYYYFVENGSSAVVDAFAVPFGLELPFTNQKGTGFITDLHVWPKNTLGDKPSIDKTVEDDVSKSNSYDVGEEFTLQIHTSVPQGIDEYVVYRIVDDLDNALDFDGESVRVSYGGTELVPGTDYILNYAATDHVITVELEQAGLDKLANLRSNDTELLTEITTTINESAVMGLPILNDAELRFDNGHGSTTEGEMPGEEPPIVEDPPRVYTGGKKFVKVNTTGETLAGAEFVVKNNEGLFLNRTNGNVKWVESQGNATVLTSEADGTFEITGLSYGELGDDNSGSTDYTLMEIKSPENYALPTNPETTFIVNASSYYSNPAELIDANPMEIENRQVTIPNTGGIGTILFTVVGLLLMVSALILFKRKRREV